jgi:hypothetical protein
LSSLALRFAQAVRDDQHIEPIIATTPKAITYSILFASFVCGTKISGRAGVLRLALKAIRTGMTPAVASATLRLALGTNIAFICYRDMTRIASCWIHVPGNATTRIEIFIHRQNLVRLHNRSFHV